MHQTYLEGETWALTLLLLSENAKILDLNLYFLYLNGVQKRTASFVSSYAELPDFGRLRVPIPAGRISFVMFQHNFFVFNILITVFDELLVPTYLTFITRLKGGSDTGTG